MKARETMVWWFVGGIAALVLFGGAFLWFIREAMRASDYEAK
jgi:hypothetical protein